MNRINNNAGGNDVEPLKSLRRAEGVQKPAAGQVKESAEAAPQGADKVQLSDAAANVARLTEQVKQAPDVRADRVEALRKLVESGNYGPDSATLADAILKEEG